MDNKVYIVKCQDYSRVESKMAELFSLMGGIEKFVSKGENIVLKVNLLQPAKPELAITTHPEVVANVAKLIKSQNADSIIVDSPGTGYQYTQKALENIYKECGMFEAAKNSGAKLNFDTTYKQVSFERGKLIKNFDVITPVLENSKVFNLCKLKTHMFMNMTGAVKNNFGVIPGLAKPGYHAKLNDKTHFANMLLDLADFVSPVLSIMDAVFGLEGDGPGAAGTPRYIGVLLASTNPLALDVAAGEIIGLPRGKNPVLIAAENRNLTPARIENIQIIGTDLDEIKISNYKFPSASLEGMGIGKLNRLQNLLAGFFKTGFSSFPKVIKKKCIGCRICKNSCPESVIKMCGGKKKYAKINDKKCIRCYCCHEMCPEKAIELKKSWLNKLIGV
jgi:uncharacterized protein (DUF362 family)/Pyruvate/2-oxoacid:ferredoxin oxidoreductase delta subunit